MLLIFVSCEKEKPENNANHYFISDRITVKNRILNFNSLENFKITINQLINNSDFAGQIKPQNFTSLLNYTQNQLKSSSSEIIEEDTLVLSDAFAALLNVEREIIVQGILYKVCKHGTLLAYPKDSLKLNEIAERETIAEIIQPVNGNVFGYSNDNPLTKFYKITSEDEIFLFDTYGQFINDKIESNSSSLGSLKSTSPNYESFTIVTENSRTLFGKAWDYLFGFSISREENFDSKTVVDVKFYAQNFVVYSETGIKVKTQQKGFLEI